MTATGGGDRCGLGGVEDERLAGLEVTGRKSYGTLDLKSQRF
jgi:hypothetical protein